MEQGERENPSTQWSVFQGQLTSEASEADIIAIKESIDTGMSESAKDKLVSLHVTQYALELVAPEITSHDILRQEVKESVESAAKYYFKIAETEQAEQLRQKADNLIQNPVPASMVLEQMHKRALINKDVLGYSRGIISVFILMENDENLPLFSTS